MICTPLVAASSIIATCLSTIRFLILSRLLSAGSSLAACISPHRTVRDIVGSSLLCAVDCPLCGLYRRLSSLRSGRLHNVITRRLDSLRYSGQSTVLWTVEATIRFAISPDAHERYLCTGLAALHRWLFETGASLLLSCRCSRSISRGSCERDSGEDCGPRAR